MVACRVSFVIQSIVVTPEVITGRLGIAPDTYWRIGSNLQPDRPGPHQLTTFNFWRIHGRTTRDDPTVEDLVLELLERLEPHAKTLTDLSRDASLGLHVHVYDHGFEVEPFGLHLDRDIVGRLASLGADLSIGLA